MKSKHTSIASFLQNSLKSIPGRSILDIDMRQPGLLSSKSNDQSLEKSISAKPLKTILEKEKWIDTNDLDSVDIEDDDMELDGIPEPSLKYT